MDRDRQFGEIPCCLSEKKPSVDFFARGFLRPSLLRAFGEGVFVGNDRNILMELENGGWYSGSHRSKTAGVNGIGLIGTAGDQKDLSGLGNGLHPHGDGLPGNVLLPLEEAGVRGDGAFRQVNLVSVFGEVIVRFVETDMGITANPQKLQVDTAQIRNQTVVPAALRIRIRSHREYGYGREQY